MPFEKELYISHFIWIRINKATELYDMCLLSIKLCILLYTLSKEAKYFFQKGWSKSIERKVQHYLSRKEPRLERTYSKRYTSWRNTSSKASSVCFQIVVSKVKKLIWQDAEEKLTSLNELGKFKRLLFLFCASLEVRRKKGTMSLLCPVINRWILKVRGLRSVNSQWIYFHEDL